MQQRQQRPAFFRSELDLCFATRILRLRIENESPTAQVLDKELHSAQLRRGGGTSGECRARQTSDPDQAEVVDNFRRDQANRLIRGARRAFD